jgi:hypothetical protein
MARLVVLDSQVFLQYMGAAANVLGNPETTLWEGLLDQWRQRVSTPQIFLRKNVFSIVSSKFDNVSEPRHRKLYAMGLAALVSTGRPEVLERLPSEVFDLWTDVFAELKEVQRQKDSELGEET